MTALVFEAYGAVCLLSLIGFLVLAARAKLRPDLDEDEFDFPVKDPIVEILSRRAPPRSVKQRKRLIQRRAHLIHMRKPRAI
jgi:hypothetical protein